LNKFLGDRNYIAMSRAIFRTILIGLPLLSVKDAMPKMRKYPLIKNLTWTLKYIRVNTALPDEDPTKLFAYHKLLHHKKIFLKEDNFHCFLNFFFARRVTTINEIIPELFCGRPDVSKINNLSVRCAIF